MSSVMDRVGLATNVEVQIVLTHLFIDAAIFVVVMALKTSQWITHLYFLPYVTDRRVSLGNG